MKVESVNRRIAKNTLYLYIRMVFVLGLNLFTTRVLLHTLGITDYGIYNVVGGVVSFMAFLQTSMANGFQRFFNIELGKGNEDRFLRLFSVSVGVQLIVGLLVLLFVETIGLWFVNTQLAIPADRMFATNIVYQSSIIVFLITLVVSLCDAIVIAYEEMRIMAVMSVVNATLKLLIAYMIIMGEDRLILYAVLIVIVQLMFAFLYVFYSFRLNERLSFKPCFDKDLLKKLMDFSGWNLFGSLSHAAEGTGVNLLLGMFFSPAINAARRVAFQVRTGMNSFFLSFQVAARPQVMKYYAQNNISEMLSLTNRISRYSFLLLWIIDLPFLFTADYFISLWLGDGIPPYALVFTNITLATIMIECLSGPIGTLVHATGRMRNYQVIASSVIMLIIPISYIILKCGGNPESVFYCSLFMAPVVQATRIILVKKLLPFSVSGYMKEVVKPCILVLLASIIPSYYINRYVQIHPVALFFVFFIIACFFVLLFGCTCGERLMLWRRIKRIFRIQ